ncbi:MAG TPA: ABC transporter permease [Solirubrobacteraceae bacterium]|jgi:phospholipid/cholesterol/gamma-HCH transport system permease protein|nr:ABC transporter permease [Solirubrobacteraceae bacterium]
MSAVSEPPRGFSPAADGAGPAGLAAGLERLRGLGAMAVLAARCARAMARPNRRRWQETVRQCGAILRASLPAAMLSIAAWGFAGPGLQAGNFLVTFGSIDRSGGFMVVAIVREFGTYVTATVVAGIVGTMFTAELGARSVRGELDALSVLGVDPVDELVAPRVLALIVCMIGLDVLALLFGVLGGYLATTLVLGGTRGAFLASFVANTTPADLIASLVKVAIFGGLIGVICAHHGLRVSGGAVDVGRAVNRAVVGCLVAIFFVNLVYTQWFLAAFPSVGVFK